MAYSPIFFNLVILTKIAKLRSLPNKPFSYMVVYARNSKIATSNSVKSKYKNNIQKFILKSMHCIKLFG